MNYRDVKSIEEIKMNDLEKLLLCVEMTEKDNQGNKDFLPFNLADYLRTGNLSWFTKNHNVREMMLTIDLDILKYKIFSRIVSYASQVIKDDNTTTNDVINSIISYGLYKISHDELPGEGHIEKIFEELLKDSNFDYMFIDAVRKKYTLKDINWGNKSEKCIQTSKFLSYESIYLDDKIDIIRNDQEHQERFNVELDRRKRLVIQYRNQLNELNKLKQQQAEIEEVLSSLEAKLFNGNNISNDMKRD